MVNGRSRIREADRQRTLAAIMFTDIVGFTALAQFDESQALRVLGRHNQLLRPLFSKFNGREVKTIGDSFLVEFNSALDATNCAVEIQNFLHDYNISTNEDWKIRLRIGVHLGDVIHEGNDIFGDAVNIASRVQPLTEPEGICISQQVYDQVRNKVSFELAELENAKLKNVTTPIKIYKVMMFWDKAVSQGSKVSASYYDRKRIAILPFANMSPDPNDEYFADGMTEELISTMSRIRGLNVIARTSIMGYKGEHKKIAEIAKELEVGTILEGSVRKFKDRLRITAQLINARSSNHLWVETYDRELQDIFAIQSDISNRVAEALRIQLHLTDKKDIERKATKNTKAYTVYLKGRHFWDERTKRSTDKAKKYFEEAVRLDPKFALAHAGLADCYVIYGDRGWLGAKEAFGKAKGYATNAIEIDPKTAEAHTSLAAVFAEFEWKWHKAELEYKQAIKYKPSYATAHHWYSIFLVVVQRLEKALDQAKLAYELDPLSRAIGYNLGLKLLVLERNREAIEQFDKVIEDNPNYPDPHNGLGFAYYLDSRSDDAISELKKAVKLSGGVHSFKADLCCVLGLCGKVGEANASLKELEQLTENSPGLASEVALAMFGTGKTDEAFRYLNRAYEQQSISMGFLTHCRLPIFVELRADPKWVLLEKQIGLK